MDEEQVELVTVLLDVLESLQVLQMSLLDRINKKWQQ
jgi:hypothetical protein